MEDKIERFAHALGEFITGLPVVFILPVIIIFVTILWLLAKGYDKFLDWWLALWGM